MKKKILVKIEKTRRGYPAFWEQGGGYTNTGEAIVIASSSGDPKKPVYIRRAGQLANREHALFVIQPGDVIIRANHHREDFNIEILQVEKFEDYDEKYSLPVISQEALIENAQQSGWVRNRGGKVLPETLGEYKSAAGHLYRYVMIRIPEAFVVCSQVAQFDMGEWDNEEAAKKFADAISAAKEKATCYHCREPHFAIV
jgi:hypothetical protein